MLFNKPTSLDIQPILSPKPTTFLMSASDIVRVIYISYSSKCKNIVADLNLEVDGVLIYDITKRDAIISSFIGFGCTIPQYREMLFTGGDLNIIKHCTEIVEKNLEHTEGILKSSYNNLLLHMQSIQYNYVYFDARHISEAQTIVDKINQLYLMYFNNIAGLNRMNCYCGITNDLDRRMEEHRNNDFAIYQDMVYAIVCRNNDITNKVEQLLSSDYSISRASVSGNEVKNLSSAGKGAEDDTNIVYLLKPELYQATPKSKQNYEGVAD